MGRALHELGIAEASELIRSRRLSPVELTRTLLDRVVQFERNPAEKFRGRVSFTHSSENRSSPMLMKWKNQVTVFAFLRPIYDQCEKKSCLLRPKHPKESSLQFGEIV